MTPVAKPNKNMGNIATKTAARKGVDMVVTLASVGGGGNGNGGGVVVGGSKGSARELVLSTAASLLLFLLGLLLSPGMITKKRDGVVLCWIDC